MRTFCLMTALVTIVGCRSTPPKPVEIESYDMCSLCRMAISQKKFAGEIIEASGTAEKFDDVGCMLRFIEQHRPQTTATFVVDYRTGQWLDAGSAYFIHSDKLQTPMGGGFAAFGDRASAAAAATEFGSVVLPYRELAATQRSAQ